MVSKTRVTRKFKSFWEFMTTNRNWKFQPKKPKPLIKESNIKGISKLFKEKEEEIKALLVKSNRLALNELEHEYILDKLTNELAAATHNEEEKAIEMMLQGVKDSRNTGKLTAYFQKLNRALNKIIRILSKINRCNKNNIETMQNIQTAIRTFRPPNKNNQLPGKLKKLYMFCLQHQSMRNDIQQLLDAILPQVEKTKDAVEEGLEKSKEFEYETAFADLEKIKAARGTLFEMLQKELKALGYEIELEKELEMMQELSDLFKKIAQDKSYVKIDKNKKRAIALAKKCVLHGLWIFHALGIGMGIQGATLPKMPFELEAKKTKTWFHKEYFKTLKYEKIKFWSRSQYECSAIFIPNPNSKKTILYCHPQTSNKWAKKEIIETFKDKYNLLLFDFLSHGETKGNFTTFGYYEQGDVLGALDYLDKKKDIHEVAIIGQSMGGSSALLAVGKLKEVFRPPNVKIVGIITQGAYAKFKEHALVYGGKSFYLPITVRKPALYGVEKITGYKPHDLNPVDAMDEKIPTLIMHGRQDPIIDPKAAKEFAKKPNVEVFEYTGSHTPLEYTQLNKMQDFLEKIHY